MNTFQTHMMRSNSVIAAHAVIRALAHRRTLQDPKKLAAYLELVCADEGHANRIAKAAVAIITHLHQVEFSDLDDETTSSYIKWLSEFVLKRATQGRAPDLDRGRTLLFELRKIKE